jgi:flagellin
MRINTNVSALTAQNNLRMNQDAANTSIAKLSSGLRINRAADDAAGLSIANVLRSNTRALGQAVNNATQANAYLSIAEGSTSTIQKILERQQELYVQSTSANNASQTATLNAEFATLSSEVQRIIDNTAYQGAAVFSATGKNFTVGDSTTGGNSIGVTVNLVSATVSLGATAVDTAAALTAVNSTLATIGAAQNRLDYTVNNLKSQIVNQKAAESVIRDLDMADEMSTFTKNNILAQAGTSMLAQANQSSQGILKLLQ